MTASAPGSAPRPSTTIGVTGLPHRWSVSEWGSIEPWPDPSESRRDAAESIGRLDWFVAADDRWHVPADEPTVRQQRIEGTPVVETRIRIPDGNAVQRVWAVPDGGGMVAIEFENESPLPFAIAVSGLPVRTERPPADVPIQGIELPADAIVLPVGHHATVRVLLPARAAASTGFPDVPPPHAVVSGWTRVVDQASRMVLPDEAITEALVTARCDLLLEGPVDATEDPEGFLLDVAELVRCGDDADAWLPEIVAPAERVARAAADETDAAARGRREERLAALDAARTVASVAGDDRAEADIERTIREVRSGTPRRSWWRGRRAASATPGVSREPAAASSFAEVRRGASVGRFVGEFERRIVEATDAPGDVAVDDLATVALLPAGMPTTWLGNNFEVHDLPAGPSTTVSFAVRWHGERPAVLWDQSGDRVRLTSPTIDPAWSTTDASGEGLWAAPPSASRARRSLSVSAPPPAPAPSPTAESAEDPRRPSTAIDVDGEDVSFG